MYTDTGYISNEEVKGVTKVQPISNRMHQILGVIKSFGRPVKHEEIALAMETTSREVEDLIWELRKAGLRCVHSSDQAGNEWISPPKGMPLK